MKAIDAEVVDGTSITIGRRVLARTTKTGIRTERISKVYTAEYRDHTGKRVARSLGTTNKREARRKAIEIQQGLEGHPAPAPPPPFKAQARQELAMSTLLDRYMDFNLSKGLTPRTITTYRGETARLKTFLAEQGVVLASSFTEEVYHRYGAWLRNRQHKQGVIYAEKSVYMSLTFCKQAMKWAWRMKLIHEDLLLTASLPKGKAAPQACFTLEQVDRMLELTQDREGWRLYHDAIAMLTFTGMRINELVALTWSDVELDRSDLGMIRVRRGGSAGTTKDKEERFIPILPRLRPVVDQIPRTSTEVLPGLVDRKMLRRIKWLSKELGFVGNYKTHSLRHTFVSMCASNGVPMRLCLAWTGHSSSAILDQYYHLHDAEATAAMRLLDAALHRSSTSR